MLSALHTNPGGAMISKVAFWLPENRAAIVVPWMGIEIVKIGMVGQQLIGGDGKKGQVAQFYGRGDTTSGRHPAGSPTKHSVAALRDCGRYLFNFFDRSGVLRPNGFCQFFSNSMDRVAEHMCVSQSGVLGGFPH